MEMWQRHALALDCNQVPRHLRLVIDQLPYVRREAGQYAFTDTELLDVLVGQHLFAGLQQGAYELLTTAQTSYATDLAIGQLAARDQHMASALVRVSRSGVTAVARVNATGILAKVPAEGSGDLAVMALRSDRDVQNLYLTAVAGRVLSMTWDRAADFVHSARGAYRPTPPHGPDDLDDSAIRRVTSELANARDVGARWCSVALLSSLGAQASDEVRSAIAKASQTEGSREALRAYATALSGQPLIAS